MPLPVDALWQYFDREPVPGKQHPKVMCKACHESWTSKETARLRSHLVKCTQTPPWFKDTVAMPPLQPPQAKRTPAKPFKISKTDRYLKVPIPAKAHYKSHKGGLAVTAALADYTNQLLLKLMEKSGKSVKDLEGSALFAIHEDGEEGEGESAGEEE